ncbi:peptide-N4-(N-acetyl-beta-glucosaminyl)asparagine amidase A-like [Durio zibethinus]|uniref:Peptide-N4-(N-acetyl-beta- glucosaminyl)asparagine amidase A-like n=1 Tax=Durio zibethinus TaxID=66656 RepID=A0A6P5WNA4_DURZI|nr:peptide-N4-(N-acetyl-beta-glucosaminyl)asparagine amidase A-like [Durio zibethinus]
MASSFSPLIYFLPLLLLDPLFSQANLHRSKTLLKSSLMSQPSTNATIPPTLFFEVTKPINVPNTNPCTLSVLQHDFGFTYGKPPVLANYNFPSDCPHQEFSRIVLEWNATCKGRQFDRIFGVWLSGVELLRSCTAEPRATGIVWSVKKDVTRYSSLLLLNKTQTFAVYLGNLVDQTYTGVYHVNVTIYFYPAVEKVNHFDEKWENLGSGVGSQADLIIPFSRDLPLNDGLWYEIENATDVKVKEFEIPQNVYRAVLEVYVSFHENDEFWYGNLPNEYIAANNLTGFAGNGPFREVVVSLDGEVVGAVWPFTVVYTGGINPLLWRPTSAIGSFDLPTYDIEITPFLGNILDGKTHKLSFGVTNALNVWYIDGNLHLWLDSKSAKTDGKLLQHDVVPLGVSSVSDFKGLNGTFVTNTTRFISSTGWVKSTYGMVTTTSIQNLSYSNSMVMGKDGNLQIVNQTIHFDDFVYVKMPASNVKSEKSLKRFLFYLYSDNLDQGNGTSLSVANFTLGFNEKKFKDADARSPNSSLRNLQEGNGVMVVKDNLVVSGVASTQQTYNYDGSKFCYFRNVSSSNYTILYDEVRNTCNKRTNSHFGFGLYRWWPFLDRKAFLESHVIDPNGN